MFVYNVLAAPVRVIPTKKRVEFLIDINYSILLILVAGLISFGGQIVVSNV